MLKHRIDTAWATPITQPMRRTPQGFEQEEEKYLRDQIEAGVIRPSNSPWSSPIVLVRKKDVGGRWCVDYHRVNDITVKDAYPLPRIDSCLDKLSSAKIFSTLDLQSGYWQLELEAQDGIHRQSKKTSNDKELIQSNPTSCPQNQKGNN